ncbi:MAG: 4-vinyl reductase [Chloroflexota bacterium]
MTHEKSGLFYPNRMARIYISSIEEMLGRGAMTAVLKQANLSHLIDNYPPNNLAREFDFADFTAIGLGIEAVYGLRALRGIATHSGKSAIQLGLDQFDVVAGMSEVAVKALPLRAKLKIGLKVMAETFSRFSDQRTTVAESDDHFIYTIHVCPICWGHTSDHPCCYTAIGLIQAGILWWTDREDIPVEQVTCIAMGSETCTFHIEKP